MKITRRGLLSGIAAAGLFGACGAEARTSDRVIVVGAGMAGLTAAKRLREAGANVIVVEGRDRIGGRVFTSRALDVPVDLGASWIHGTTKNPITQLAKDLGVRTRATDYDSIHLFDRDGSAISDAVASEIGEGIDWLADRIEAAGENLENDISVAQAVEAAIAGESLEPLERRALEWVRSTVVLAAAEDLEKLSLRYFDDDRGMRGDDALFPGGYDAIPGAIARGTDVRLGEVVKRIEHSTKGVRVQTSKAVHEADRVLVTVPLGVLKGGAIEFSPALPDAKRAAIAALGMGVLDKVALRFDRAFWPADREFLGYVAEVGSLEPPVVMNASIFAGAPVLMAFVGGDAARRMEREQDRAIVDRVVALLSKVTGRPAPAPSKVAISRWGTDPFALGSYAHVPLGSTSEAYDRLADPVGDRLFFAGEATHRDQRGTVHGAYLSGLREAERIISIRR
jgi:monoamine oxidase